MYEDNQSIKAFERRRARERLAEEARHLGDDDEAETLGPHLAGEREAQRVMLVAALLAVAGLLGWALYAALA